MILLIRIGIDTMMPRAASKVILTHVYYYVSCALLILIYGLIAACLYDALMALPAYWESARSFGLRPLSLIFSPAIATASFQHYCHYFFHGHTTTYACHTNISLLSRVYGRAPYRHIFIYTFWQHLYTSFSCFEGYFGVALFSLMRQCHYAARAPLAWHRRSHAMPLASKRNVALCHAAAPPTSLHFSTGTPHAATLIAT